MVAYGFVVVLDGAGDELGSVAPRLRGEEVLILKQPTAGWELPQELLHHLELFLRGGLSGLAGIDALHTVTGSSILDVVAEMSGGFRAAALDVRTLENDARRCWSPPVLQSYL